jgi:predicted NBD/HSP70 family sugar kinase
MGHYVGLDVGKSSHWACVLDEQGEVILSRRVEATEEALEAACKEIAELGVTDERVVGIDLMGGPRRCWRCRPRRGATKGCCVGRRASVP